MDTKIFERRPGKRVSLLLCAMLAAVFTLLSAGAAIAAKGIPTEVPIGKSVIINLPAGIQRVSLTDPAIADVVVVTPKELQINGKKIGSTSLIVWDKSGAKTFFELSVTVDVEGLKDKIAEVAPGDDVHLKMISADTLVVTGTVATDERRLKIHNLLLGFGKDITEKDLFVLEGGVTKEVRSGGGEAKGFKFVMLLEVAGSPEVLLQITVASIDRTATRDLGINWAYAASQAIGVFSGTGGVTTGSAAVTSALNLLASGSTAVTGVVPGPGGPQFGVIDTRNNMAYFLKALAGKGLAKILAEPNLIVKSGAKGRFEAGGEFPFPEVTSVSGGSGGSLTIPSVSITFKPFGVIMDFEPTVKESGLIQLMLVNAEVSSLDFANGITVGGTQVPLIKKDNVHTSVDLRDGESFVIAGLLKEEWSKNLNKIPLLGDIPILGAFFRDQHMNKDERELVFVVTPKLVKPMAPGARVDLPGSAEPTARQEEDLRWIPLMPTTRSNDAEQLR